MAIFAKLFEAAHAQALLTIETVRRGQYFLRLRFEFDDGIEGRLDIHAEGIEWAQAKLILDEYQPSLAWTVVKSVVAVEIEEVAAPAAAPVPNQGSSRVSATWFSRQGLANDKFQATQGPQLLECDTVPSAVMQASVLDTYPENLGLDDAVFSGLLSGSDETPCLELQSPKYLFLLYETGLLRRECLLVKGYQNKVRAFEDFKLAPFGDSVEKLMKIQNIPCDVNYRVFEETDNWILFGDNTQDHQYKVWIDGTLDVIPTK